MSSALLVRLTAVLLFLGFVTFAVKENRKPEEPPRAPEAEVVEAPPGGYRNPVALFTWILLSAVTGIFVAKWAMSLINEKVEDAVTSDADQPLKVRAMRQVYEGNYPKALELLRQYRAESPQDRFPVIEMARVHEERLGDPEAAIRMLEEALAGEWEPEDRGQLLLRLAGLYESARSDMVKVKELLTEVQGTCPGTQAASAARDRIHEIEEQEFLGRMQS